jgi:hypothetical protein
MLGCGATFLLPKSSASTEHLWIVLTEPDATTGKAVCVNVTTRQPFSETTVILQPGEHPFVKHESVVHYADASFLDLKLIDAALSLKTSKFVCVTHQTCSPELLKKVRDGLIKSKFVSAGIKDFCKKAWNA